MQQQSLTKIFAVFGDPIGHSLSPVMHNAAFRALGMDCAYHAFRVSRENLKSAILGAQAMGFGGLNLTIPLKEEALSIVSPEPMASSIGAVNTVSFDAEKGPVGNNTDGIGAKRALLDAGVDVAKKNVVIIGAGGAARAIAFQFAHDGANVHIANRTEKRAVALAHDVRVGLADTSTSQVTATAMITAGGLEDMQKFMETCDILINSTSVGMHPNTDETPVPARFLRSDMVIFDIVYNPRQTRLLLDGAAIGATTVGGLMMLIHQGAEAFRIWTGVDPPVDVMVEAVEAELQRRATA